MPNLRISSSTGIAGRVAERRLRHRDAVALDRDDRQAHAERAHQQRAVGAERQHVGIGAERPAVGVDRGDAAAVGRQAQDGGAEAEPGAALAAPGGEVLAEPEAVAALLVDIVDAADQRPAARRECRHEVDAALAVEHRVAQAERPLALGDGDRLIEALLVRIDLERAAGHGVVLHAGRRADLLERLEAVEREPQHVAGVGPRRARAWRRAGSRGPSARSAAAGPCGSGSARRAAPWSRKVLVGTPGADQGTAWLIATKPPLAWLHSRATPGWRSTSVTSWPSRSR